MATRSIVVTVGMLCFLVPFTVVAQVQSDIAPLKNWPTPLYWQPTQAEDAASPAMRSTFGDARAVTSASNVTPQAATPVGALVFVAMTPCRVVDTRSGFGFTGAFGPPSLAGGGIRTFPIQSSTTCSIPSIAQAYSFNVTIVPPGFVNWVTVFPTGQPQPNASTLNGYSGTVIANAAIVPAGTGGSVDVFASHNTDLIIDINGYYAPQSGVTLAQGTAAAPPMSFAGDPGTGIFSSGAGTVNIATGGTSRLSVGSTGVGTGTSTPGLTVNGPVGIWGRNQAYFYTDQGATLRGYVGQGLAGDLSLIGRSSGDWLRLGANNGNIAFWTNGNADLDNNPQMFLAPNGLFVTSGVGIGTTDLTFGERLHVDSDGGSAAVLGTASNQGAIGVYGYATGNSSYGVYGAALGTGGVGVLANAAVSGGIGVLASGDAAAGYFRGKVVVTVLGSAGGTALCINGSAEIAACSSSLRYKNNVQTFLGGLDIIQRLRPISFDWKEGGAHDVGLAAEEVEKVEPLLTFHNNKGDIEGVKYNQLSAVFINAFKEQQGQIESQQKTITQQQVQIDELKRFFCLDHPQVDVCR